jgi:hypothetical protein
VTNYFEVCPRCGHVEPVSEEDYWQVKNPRRQQPGGVRCVSCTDLAQAEAVEQEQDQQLSDQDR